MLFKNCIFLANNDYSDADGLHYVYLASSNELHDLVCNRIH